MKISKSTIVMISSLLCISSLTLLTYASDTKNLLINPQNAKQRINSIKLIDDTTRSILSGSNSLNIITDNLIITTTGDNKNEINNSKKSSILGGKKNKINNGNTGTIIGGYNNTLLKGSSSIIGGGSGNTITGDNSTIIGGKSNKISGNLSTILGSDNTINGNYSTILGTNNTVSGNLSFVLGKNGTINNDNAFLWNDGNNNTTSNSKNTFSVISENGMVVNTNKAEENAQLTISGSLSIFDSFKNENIKCGDNKGKGILKVMDKGNNQVCFCSCDGKNRSSIFGKGQCEGVCKGGSLEPECAETISKEEKDENSFYLTGGCEKGKIVLLSGNNSRYNNSTTRYRACQTDDGTTKTCSGSISY